MIEIFVIVIYMFVLKLDAYLIAPLRRGYNQSGPSEANLSVEFQPSSLRSQIEYRKSHSSVTQNSKKPMQIYVTQENAGDDHALPPVMSVVVTMVTGVM